MTPEIAFLPGASGARIGDGSDLVAQSMGGIVAIGLALRHPARVRRLVLEATSGGLDMGALGGSDWREEYRVEFPDAAAWVSDDSIDFSEQLHAVTVTVLLLWGDADPISPLAVGQELHRRLPDSMLRVIPGGDHAMAHDGPAEIAAVVAVFVSAETVQL